MARGFYGEAFEPVRRADLAAAMADWSEMSEAERSFVLAHLHYLDLLAQRTTQRMLARLRAELVALGEELAGDFDEEEEGGEGE